MQAQPPGADQFPFKLSMPRLITHRPQTQVIQCDYVDPSGRAKDSCILKLFSPRARIAYEKEVSAYSLLQAQ